MDWQWVEYPKGNVLMGLSSGLVGIKIMENSLREAAIAHAPFFITAPGETDILFHGIAWFVVLAVFALGAFYLTLHALPEKLAHHANHTQIQLIGVLTLLALFTHNGVFWVAALVLAVVRFPDFISPIQAIADSLKTIARNKGEFGDSTRHEPVTEASVTPDMTQQENPKDV